MANSSYGMPVTDSHTSAACASACVEYPEAVPGSNASLAVRGSPVRPRTYSQLPSFGAPVASGQIPDVWFRSCRTVMEAFLGSESGCAHGMKEKARSSNRKGCGPSPARLRSDATARTVAQIAFETDATLRASVFALLPR